MKYVFILVAAQGIEPDSNSKEWSQYGLEFSEFNKAALKADVLIDGYPLKAPNFARTVRMVSDEITVSSATFAELNENIVGWYIFECESIEVAQYWACKIPLVYRGFGAAEIRPIISYS